MARQDGISYAKRALGLNKSGYITGTVVSSSGNSCTIRQGGRVYTTSTAIPNLPATARVLVDATTGAVLGIVPNKGNMEELTP
jgi:hypothetical protein